MLQLRGEREELESIIEGEQAALDKKLFDEIDQDGKDYLAFDDVYHLAVARPCA